MEVASTAVPPEVGDPSDAPVEPSSEEVVLSLVGYGAVVVVAKPDDPIAPVAAMSYQRTTPSLTQLLRLHQTPQSAAARKLHIGPSLP